MFQNLLNTCDRVAEILDSESNHHCCFPVETFLEVEIRRLFDIAEIVFASEEQPQKDHKKLLYVAYLIRRFDSEDERVTIKLQFCQREDNSSDYALFLGTWWEFGEVAIRNVFDADGFPDYECVWDMESSTYIMNIFQELECLGSAETETPQAITDELLKLWEDLIEVEVGELVL